MDRDFDENDENGQACYTAQKEFTQNFPDDGWVEHDPEEIWSTILAVVEDALSKARQDNITVAALGITNHS